MEFSSNLSGATVLFFFNMVLFILFFWHGCAGSLLLRGLFSSCGEQGLLSSCVAQAAHCMTSLVVEHGL